MSEQTTKAMQRGAFEENMFSRMEAANQIASKSIDDIKKASWNEAIERAADKLDQIKGCQGIGDNDSVEIRKLKK